MGNQESTTMGGCESKTTIQKTKAMKDLDDKPVLVYWELHGRSDFCQSMLKAGGIEYVLDTETANQWPSTRDETPFGQIPVLKHKGLTMGQGGAITRYCARLAGFYPSDDVEASICDMFLDEAMDIFNALFKAKNAPDKEAKLAAWENIEKEHIPKHFDFLEKYLEKNGQPFLGGGAPNASDIAFFAVYGVYNKAGVNVEGAISSYPNLKNALEETTKLGDLASFPEYGLYFTSDPEHASF